MDSLRIAFIVIGLALHASWAGAAALTGAGVSRGISLPFTPAPRERLEALQGYARTEGGARLLQAYPEMRVLLELRIDSSEDLRIVRGFAPDNVIELVAQAGKSPGGFAALAKALNAHRAKSGGVVHSALRTRQEDINTALLRGAMGASELSQAAREVRRLSLFFAFGHKIIDDLSALAHAARHLKDSETLASGERLAENLTGVSKSEPSPAVEALDAWWDEPLKEK